MNIKRLLESLTYQEQLVLRDMLIGKNPTPPTAEEYKNIPNGKIVTTCEGDSGIEYTYLKLADVFYILGNDNMYRTIDLINNGQQIVDVSTVDEYIEKKGYDK